MNKICARCKLTLNVSNFHVNSRTKDGLHSYCKACNKEKSAAHLKTKKGKIALKKAISKKAKAGYYRYGKGAIPILKNGALKRDVEFDLTAESLENWWLGNIDKCHYCGRSIEQFILLRNFVKKYNGKNYEIDKFKRFFRSSKHANISWMTIDRADNSKGYCLENIVKSCWICNSLKSDFFTEKQFKSIAPEIIASLEYAIAEESHNNAMQGDIQGCATFV